MSPPEELLVMRKGNRLGFTVKWKNSEVTCSKGTYISNSKFFTIIYTRNRGFSLSNEVVFVDIVRQQTFFWRGKKEKRLSSSIWSFVELNKGYINKNIYKDSSLESSMYKKYTTKTIHNHCCKKSSIFPLQWNIIFLYHSKISIENCGNYFLRIIANFSKQSCFGVLV